MTSVDYYLNEAQRWERRCEENYAKADTYKDDNCRRTMLGLARHAEQEAERAVALAINSAHPEDADMQSKGGLHPYRAALFFILREQHNGHRTSRKQRAAMQSGNVDNISDWQMVRLIAHSFGKSGREVARDLVDEYLTLEQGQVAP